MAITELTDRTAGRTRPPRDRVRNDLLAAAHTTFMAKGYRSGTLAEIAANAGYTKGAVYSNFGSKEELFAEMCRAEFAATTQRLLQELVATVGPPDGADTWPSELSDEAADQLTRLVTAQAELQAAAGEFRSLAHHSPRASATYSALRRDQIDLLTAELARLRFLGRDPDPDAPREAALILLATIDAFAMEHRAAPETFPPHQLASSLARLIRSLLP